MPRGATRGPPQTDAKKRPCAVGRVLWCAACTIVLLCSRVGSLAAAQDSLYSDVRPTMGTIAEILLYAPDGARARELIEAAFTEIAYADSTLSTYRATSEVSRINAGAAERPVTTDPEVFGLLSRAVDWSRRTGGAFDVTVGPLVEAWGFFGGRGHLPSRRALDRARRRSGWTRLALDSARRTVRFLTSGMELDFGAIGKGWALDRAAGALRRLGVRTALLGLGRSSYVAIGAPPGQPGWRVNVADPRDTATVVSAVILRDGSLATSGANQKFFEIDGRRYGHILDPRTGAPVDGMAQVTVTAPSATESDALSTALFVLGADHAGPLLDSVAGAGALLIRERDGGDRVVRVRWPGT